MAKEKESKLDKDEQFYARLDGKHEAMDMIENGAIPDLVPNYCSLIASECYSNNYYDYMCGVREVTRKYMKGY